MPIYAHRGVFCCLILLRGGDVNTLYRKRTQSVCVADEEQAGGLTIMTAWFTGWMRPAGPAGHTGPDGRTASVNIRSALSRPDAVTREQALKKKPT